MVTIAPLPGRRANINDAIARTVWPPLTTICQPTYQLAYRAADLLLETLLTGNTPKPVRLAHTLVRRDSTGVAPRPK